MGVREIKFRALNHQGIWIYGTSNYLAPMADNTLLPLSQFFELFTIGKLRRDTVGEYTGLKDKNDKEIYEGDIVSYTRFGWQCIGHPKHNTDLVTTYEIIWSEEDCAFRATNIHVTCGLIFDDSRATKNEIEVIGNIYENPGLLEQNPEMP
jgi:uncharacterized phage protein (TIGR01671 family)